MYACYLSLSLSLSLHIYIYIYTYIHIYKQALEKLATVQMFSEETCITVRESRPSREEDQKEQLEKPVQKGPSKTARCWRLARALFFYACVLHSIRRRRRAGMIVDQIVRGIVRTKNLHQGCARLLRNVRTAQGLVRQLLARKQKFIDNATKMWVKWEDIHLQVCFNKDGAAKATRSQRQGQASRSQGKG